ncbi:N-acetyltransferase [Candidatus Poribacteria bacterium]|nr:N-acetyltransferase [Candidatus Poribacteria bacterium]
MIRKAKVEDVQAIQNLINFYAKKNKMLSRSLSELYENIRDFFVYEKNNEILGVCALHPSWENLAELKSLAVKKEAQKTGIGEELLKACLFDAYNLGIKNIFVLTYKTNFFKKRGFSIIEKSELPHKVWNECIKCILFPNCNEVPLKIELKSKDSIGICISDKKKKKHKG